MPEIIVFSDTDAPELGMYRQQRETQLLHWYEPEAGIFLAESPKVIERALLAGYEPLSILCERRDITGEAAEVIEAAGVSVYTADSEIITELTGFKLIRGAICAMRRRPLPAPLDICLGARRIAVLENVVNPTHVGAIVRSAAALGIEAVLLTDTCSDPLYRRSSRVSMGTVFQVPWTYMSGALTDMELLHGMGFKTAAMALVEDSVDIDDEHLNSEEQLAVILGAEGDGLSKETISASDYSICIPRSNEMDSLNVAAASAVAFWQVCRGKQ